MKRLPGGAEFDPVVHHWSLVAESLLQDAKRHVGMIRAGYDRWNELEEVLRRVDGLYEEVEKSYGIRQKMAEEAASKT